MTKQAELPDDLKHSECNRGNIAKQGGRIPPICFIHPKANLDKEAATAAIYMSREVKEEFTRYSGGNTELAIAHVRLFKLIIDKCNFRKEQEIMQFSLNTLQSEYDALETCASARGKKLKQDLDKAQKEVKGYIDTTFKYFQDLLNESLVQEWNQVV